MESDDDLHHEQSIQALLQQDPVLYRSYQQLRKTVTCSICLEVFSTPVTLPCSHSYCKECAEQAIRIRGKCPMCMRSVRVNQWKEEDTKYITEILAMLKNFILMVDPHQSMLSSSQDLLAGTALIGGGSNGPNIGGTTKGNPKANTGTTLVASSSQYRPGSSWASVHSTASLVPLPTTGYTFISGSGSSSSSSGAPLVIAESANKPPSLAPAPPSSSSSSGGVIMTTPRENIITSTNAPVPTTVTRSAPEEPQPAVPKVVFPIGALVNVLPRTWANINRLGGVGRVVHRVEEDDISYYRVKYVLDGGQDDNVHELFVEEFKELDRSSRRRAPASTSNSHALSTPKTVTTGTEQNGEGGGNSSDKKRKLASSSSRETLAPSPSTLMHGGGVSMMSPSNSAAANNNAGGGSSGKKMRPPLPSGNVGRSLFTTQVDTLPGSSTITGQSSSGSSCNRMIRILTTSIDEGPAFDKKLEKFQQALQHQNVSIELETHFTETATHLIVSVDKQSHYAKQRTMKYMMAIAHGMWIVSTQWIVDCIKHKELLAEDKYEAAGNVKALMDFAPRRSRIAHESKTELLLSDFRVLLFGGFPLPGPPKSDAMTLTMACGATMVTSVSDDFVKFLHEATSVDSEADYDTLMVSFIFSFK